MPPSWPHPCSAIRLSCQRSFRLAHLFRSVFSTVDCAPRSPPRSVWDSHDQERGACLTFAACQFESRCILVQCTCIPPASNLSVGILLCPHSTSPTTYFRLLPNSTSSLYRFDLLRGPNRALCTGLHPSVTCLAHHFHTVCRPSLPVTVAVHAFGNPPDRHVLKSPIYA